MSDARVPGTEVTGLYGAVVKLAMRRMLGKVPDSLGVMWQHPRIFKDLVGFGRKTEKWGELDPELAAFARMASAARIGCDACLDINYFLTHHHGLDAEKAREVPRWRESEVFTPLQRRAMAYAEAMSLTPPAVTDEQSAELLADLGAPGLLELTAVVGVMNLNARSNLALGIHAEGFAESCGLRPLAEPVAVVPSPS